MLRTYWLGTVLSPGGMGESAVSSNNKMETLVPRETAPQSTPH